MKRTPLRPRGRKRHNVVRDPQYLAWIRTLPCACAPSDGCSALIEAHHHGHYGTARKTDYNCIPLCSNHHRWARNSAHRSRKLFARVLPDEDIETLQVELLRAYRDETRAA